MRLLLVWRFELDFFPSQLSCGQPYKFCLEANPIWYSTIKFMKSHSGKCSLHKWAWLGRSINWSQLVWQVQIWPIFASQWVDSAGTCAYLCFGLLVSCYSLLQHSRLAWLELFVDHTHTRSMNNLRWQLHWLPGLTSLLRKSRDWWRTRDSSLGQPTENKIDYKPT